MTDLIDKLMCAGDHSYSRCDACEMRALRSRLGIAIARLDMMRLGGKVPFWRMPAAKGKP